MAVLSYWAMFTLNADHHPPMSRVLTWSAARVASEGQAQVIPIERSDVDL